MSLINQMLKDLDARHESAARGQLHREVRALPQPTGTRAVWWGVAALIVALGAGGGWWAYTNLPAFEAAPAALLPVPPAVVAPQVLAESVAATATLSATQVEPVVEPLRTTQDAESGMKMAAMLEQLPTAAPVKRPPSAAAPEPAPAKPTAAPAKAAAPGAIDKTPVARSARERSDAEYRQAVTLVNGARVQEAVDVLLGVLQQDGGHVASRQLLARLLVEQRRFDEAKAILAEGLIGQPGQYAWATMLARLQVEAGDLAGAARTLQQSDAYATASADYQGFYGHVLHRLGRHPAAVEHYQLATRLAPADGRWWLGLGLALEAEQRAPEAREAFARARASGSLNPDLAAVVDQKLR